MSGPKGAGYSTRVAQASGMVSAQANCLLSHALVLMEIRAEETHKTLEQIATAVIDREMRFGV